MHVFLPQSRFCWFVQSSPLGFWLATDQCGPAWRACRSTACGRSAMRSTGKRPALRPREESCSLATHPHSRPPVDVQRQQAQDRPVRRELFLRPRRHAGAGALVGKLAGQSQARAHGGRGRHRLHAADRPLERLWRRHRLSGRDAGNHHLGDRAARLEQAHHRVRHRACAAVQSDHGGQGDGHRRPCRRGPLRAEHRRRLERGRVRNVRRPAARARAALRIRPGMDRRHQDDLVGQGGLRLPRPIPRPEENSRQAEAVRRQRSR